MRTFFLQTTNGFEIQGIAFMANLFYKQGLFADAVVQNHDAELPAKVGGIHEDIGGLYHGKIWFCLCFS